MCVYSTHLRWRVRRLRACSSGSCSWSRVRPAPWGRRGGWVLLPPAAGPVWRSASLKHTGVKSQRDTERQRGPKWAWSDGLPAADRTQEQEEGRRQDKMKAAGQKTIQSRSYTAGTQFLLVHILVITMCHKAVFHSQWHVNHVVNDLMDWWEIRPHTRTGYSDGSWYSWKEKGEIG